MTATSDTADTTNTTSYDPASEPATTQAQPDTPAIVQFALTPDPITDNGLISVQVEARFSDGVRLEHGGGETLELASDGAGNYEGQIPAFTGLNNGVHHAALVPWRDTLDGEPVDATYTIALPEPGSQYYWDHGDLTNAGTVAAVGALLDGNFVEFGNYYKYGDDQPTCYLRMRQQDGTWWLTDFVHVLDGTYCTAIDMKIDPELGTIHLLAQRKSDGRRGRLVGKRRQADRRRRGRRPARGARAASRLARSVRLENHGDPRPRRRGLAGPRQTARRAAPVRLSAHWNSTPLLR